LKTIDLGGGGGDGGGGGAGAFGGGGEVTFVVFDADGGGGGHGETRYHALGGPSVDDVPSKRAYDASHADASPNMLLMSVTELVSHPEMSALNADA